MAMSEFELTEEEAAAIEARQAEGCPDGWEPEGCDGDGGSDGEDGGSNG